MKPLSLLLCALLLAVAAPVQPAHAQAAVSIDFFYDALSPYGDWIYTSDYGYVFQPNLAQQAYWSPYSDGYWAFTDGGWTWISNEVFGWATYHYGRWIRMFGLWVWIPGYEWAPAWVSWRLADDYIGWAPLPPEARWYANIGFHGWTDGYYGVGPMYYNFVPVRSFATRTSLRPFIVDRRRNAIFIDQSVNVTNITYRQNVVNNIFVGGPDPARIDRLGEHRVRRLSLRRDDTQFRRDWLDDTRDGSRSLRSLSRIENDQLVVAAPTLKKEAPKALPPRVRESFDRPDIDRGWQGVSDPTLTARLQERQRQEVAKAGKEDLPDKAPLIVTGHAPPPAVGRPLQPEERRGAVQRPDPRRIHEDVPKAVPPAKPGAARPGTTDAPPAPDDTRQPKGRDVRPPDLGPSGRPDLRPDGRPGHGPDGRPDRDDVNPQVKPGGRPGHPSETKPEREPPRPQLIRPGVIPGDDGNRHRGGVPRADEPRSPTAPKVTPQLPKLPPSPPAAPPKVKPMPEPPSRPQVPPRRMPAPEAPQVKPVPMPQPQAPAQQRPQMKQPPAPQARPQTPAPQPPSIPRGKKPEDKRPNG